MEVAREQVAHHVVVAVDGSEAGNLAILWAIRHVLKPYDDLHLIEVGALSDCKRHI